MRSLDAADTDEEVLVGVRGESDDRRAVVKTDGRGDK
jgi:hypothetical protein